MEKVCRTSAVKTSSIPLFNFGKYPKTADAWNRLLEIIYFKKYQSLFMSKIMHPVPFYEQDYEKQNRSGTRG